MEVIVSAQLQNVAKYDMLPNLVVGAGYTSRNNYSGGDSRPLFGPQVSRLDVAQARSGSLSTSSEPNCRLASIEFNWNVQNYHEFFYRTKQKADEFLIAQERKRHALQTMVLGVRYAFLRLLATQRNNLNP